jgi:hypothetical protein
MRTTGRLLACFGVACLAVAVAGSGVAAKTKDAVAKLSSRWGNCDSNSEHGPLTEFSKNSPFSIGACNDQDFLYLVLRTSDSGMRMRMLQEGLVVWFDPKGGTKKEFGIEYPTGQRGGRGGRPGGYGGRQRGGDVDAMWAQAQSDGALNALEVLGPKKEDRLRLVTSRTDDPKVTISTAEGTVTYQIRVPLSATGEYHYTVGAAPGSVIGLGLATPSDDEEEGRTAMRGGRGSGRGGGGRGGRGGRGGYGGYGGGGDFERPKPLKEWTTLKLASN